MAKVLMLTFSHPNSCTKKVLERILASTTSASPGHATQDFLNSQKTSSIDTEELDGSEIAKVDEANFEHNTIVVQYVVVQAIKQLYSTHGIKPTTQELVEVQAIMTLVSGLARQVDKSPVARTKFLECISMFPELKSSGCKSLGQRVATRLNSDRKALDNQLHLWCPVQLLTSDKDLNLNRFALGSKQRLLAEELSDALEVFEIPTCYFSSSKLPLVHKVLLALIEMKQSLIDMQSSADISPATQVGAQAALNVFNKYMENVSICELYFIFMAMCPDIKFTWFRKYYDGSTVEKIRDMISTRFKVLYPSTDVESQMPAQISRPKNRWIHTQAALNHPSVPQQDSIDAYSSSDPDPVTLYGGVLPYWPSMLESSPRVARMALNYLTAPATSVDAERAFSAGRLTINHLQHNMASKTFEAKMAVGSWYGTPLLPGISEIASLDKPKPPAQLLWLDLPLKASLAQADPLWQVKLLAALRAGDVAQIQSFLHDLRPSRTSNQPSADPDGKAATIVHFAVRSATCDTIECVLANKYISPNLASPPDSGFTAIHLASSIGRIDALGVLLDQEGADDTLVDSRGQSILDVAKDQRTRQVIQESQEAFRRHFTTALSRYISSPLPTPSSGSLELLNILRSPRVKLLDLSALDPTSGTTLLHEAVRRRDQMLVETAVHVGADVFVRDQKGKGLLDGDKDKDGERIRVFLRQYLNQDVTLIGSVSTDPPNYRGYLSKYANVAKGYNTRWFVLKDDMLSYYRSREDEGLAVRGAISVRAARLKTTPGDKLRFEIHAHTPSAQSGHSVGSAGQKWYMKANHPGEVARWVQMINRSIEFYQQKERGQQPPANSDSESMQSAHESSRRTKSLRSSVDMLRGWSARSTHGANRSRQSINQPPPAGTETPHTVGGTNEAESQEDDSRSVSSAATESSQIPHGEQFQLQNRATQMEVDLARQLLDQLVLPDGSSPRLVEVKAALERSLLTLKDSINQCAAMTEEREAWFSARVEREADARRMWEDNVVALANQSEQVERELVRSVQINKGQRRVLRTLLGSSGEDPSTPRATIDIIAPVAEQSPPVSVSLPPPRLERLDAPTQLALPEAAHSPLRSPLASKLVDPETEGILGEDSDDEFFDAIESGAISNLPSAILPRPSTLVSPSVNQESYQGYAHLRDRLPIGSDNRPPVSLWAVLKGSIGKDLTKISFPVFFNEPTSMLQRMAEDMEFSECLDAAANERDAHKRIAYVAAFAMSNYSSTIGRIAKPFNPMLGETFEYCRLDRQYRYVSEQVSHHPPMSACWAESPSWNYYGEVDAKNKFMGKSFEIRPTGVAHAALKLPEDWAPGYPPAKGDPETNHGKVIEHYSWKKVTTNVSGFIVGQPTIDHYGDMKASDHQRLETLLILPQVVNHRTGDTCLLTFKPRGWRAKDSFEIKGSIQDASGRVTWEIAGRWNSQLLARPAGTGAGDLLPDADSSASQYLLLWKNTEKPAAPFNLTPFAITLNDCPPDTLAPYLPPTDCRIRPDQRAFEGGRYERANDLKSMQEDFQRATRRKRELGEIPPHKPRWFSETIDEDSGERVWQPSREGERLEYWAERERVFKQGGKGKASWQDVDEIFITEE